MVNKCAAHGCKTGYDSENEEQEDEESISWGEKDTDSK